MKHEIFIKYNSTTDEQKLKNDIKSLISIPFISKYTLRPELLKSLKDRKLPNMPIKNLEILDNSFHIYFDSTTPEAVIISLIRNINKLTNVATSRYNGIISSSSIFPALDPAPEKNPDFFNQQHHFLSPLGVDSMYGWMFPGGSGNGINIFITDTEVTTNSDINFELVGNYNIPNGTHGTQVAGLIASLNNDTAGIGIVPDASLYISWFGGFEGAYEIGKAGDIINLSIGYNLSGVNYPWPIYDENIVKIQLASALGIATCYCSSNGNLNLDTVSSSGRYFMDRNSEDFIDNTGICVGGAYVLNKVTPWREYNYGSIVDVFAQSSNAYSIFGNFSGTSASTPIISGLAAQVQSIRMAHGKDPLTPKELRDLLSNPELGIKGENTHSNDNAVMPDMRKIMSSMNIKPENDYQKDYGLTMDEKETIDGHVNSLFLDSNHCNLKPDVSLQDILAIQSIVFQEKPSEHKLNALTDIENAILLYNEMNDGELVDNYNFKRKDENWIFQAQDVQFIDNGVILSGSNERGVLGAHYTLPMSFSSSEDGMRISSKIEILEYDTKNTVEVTLGHYSPGIDAILNYNLYTNIETSDPMVDISFIVNSSANTTLIFPAVGVKGAKKILLKEISIKPNSKD